ncbi:MAG: hypothetical protein AAF441_21945 [Pseudomonadota bacterium]
MINGKTLALTIAAGAAGAFMLNAAASLTNDAVAGAAVGNVAMEVPRDIGQAGNAAFHGIWVTRGNKISFCSFSGSSVACTSNNLP